MGSAAAPFRAQFVGINLWDNPGNARQFLEQVRPTYAMAADSSGETAIAYGVRGLPETFFVDPSGQLARRWIGPITTRQLDATLAELVGRP
jgi:cytochrome c biogenesis protein CcmG, thiol:disulfide interchange protein DsbE